MATRKSKRAPARTRAVKESVAQKSAVKEAAVKEAAVKKAAAKNATGKTAAVKESARKTTAVKRRTAKVSPSQLPPRRQSESLRLRSFAPGFTASDLEASVAFYTHALGFVVADRWAEGGELRGVMLKAGSCELGLSQDDWAKGRARKKGQGVRIWCETDQDIDALANRIKAAGGRLSEEPTNHSWGVRSLSVDDPDGFHLTIYREL